MKPRQASPLLLFLGKVVIQPQSENRRSSAAKESFLRVHTTLTTTARSPRNRAVKVEP